MTPAKSSKPEPPRYTRFEKARIVGARALQIGMGAPVLLKHPKDMRNPVDLALLEYAEDLIPITVQRAPPPRSTLAETNTNRDG